MPGTATLAVNPCIPRSPRPLRRHPKALADWSPQLCSDKGRYLGKCHRVVQPFFQSRMSTPASKHWRSKVSARALKQTVSNVGSVSLKMRMSLLLFAVQGALSLSIWAAWIAGLGRAHLVTTPRALTGKPTMLQSIRLYMRIANPSIVATKEHLTLSFRVPTRLGTTESWKK